MSTNDLATGASDLASGSTDLAGSSTDLATMTDLAGYSNVGDPCGPGPVPPAKQCLPGLVCIAGTPGTCALPDAGSCHANGASCTQPSDCCSNNCIMRGRAPYCCIPGGCP